MNRRDIETSAAPHFIGCWQWDDDGICEEIIEFFTHHQQLHTSGAIGGGVNPSKKKTTDITIHPNDLADPDYQVFERYFQALQRLFLDYKTQWPFLDTFLDRVHLGSFNVQRYKPGDHFSNLHAERTHISTLHRVLAFMTYLNDVEAGGTTVFDHYDVSVQPQKGKTLIWPAEWTHAHSGSVVEAGEKYIVTGWMHFPH